jgi:hypothetical protein
LFGISGAGIIVITGVNAHPVHAAVSGGGVPVIAVEWSVAACAVYQRIGRARIVVIAPMIALPLEAKIKRGRITVIAVHGDKPASAPRAQVCRAGIAIVTGKRNM